MGLEKKRKKSKLMDTQVSSKNTNINKIKIVLNAEEAKFKGKKKRVNKKATAKPKQQQQQQQQPQQPQPRFSPIPVNHYENLFSGLSNQFASLNARVRSHLDNPKNVALTSVPTTTKSNIVRVNMGTDTNDFGEGFSSPLSFGDNTEPYDQQTEPIIPSVSNLPPTEIGSTEIENIGELTTIEPVIEPVVEPVIEPVVEPVVEPKKPVVIPSQPFNRPFFPQNIPKQSLLTNAVDTLSRQAEEVASPTEVVSKQAEEVASKQAEEVGSPTEEVVSPKQLKKKEKADTKLVNREYNSLISMYKPTTLEEELLLEQYKKSANKSKKQELITFKEKEDTETFMNKLNREIASTDIDMDKAVLDKIKRIANEVYKGDMKLKDAFFSDFLTDTHKKDTIVYLYNNQRKTFNDTLIKFITKPRTITSYFETKFY
jgi:hypothetical protein